MNFITTNELHFSKCNTMNFILSLFIITADGGRARISTCQRKRVRGFAIMYGMRNIPYKTLPNFQNTSSRLQKPVGSSEKFPGKILKEGIRE